MEEKEKETVGTLVGEEAGRTAETSLLWFSVSSSGNVDEFSGKLSEETVGEVSLSAPKIQEQLQVMTPDSTKDVPKPSDEIQSQSLQVRHCNNSSQFIKSRNMLKNLN